MYWLRCATYVRGSLLQTPRREKPEKQRPRCTHPRARCRCCNRRTALHSDAPISSAYPRFVCDSSPSCDKSRRIPVVPEQTIVALSSTASLLPAGYPERHSGQSGCTRTSELWRGSPHHLSEGQGWTRAVALSKSEPMDRAGILFLSFDPGCPSSSSGSVRSESHQCRFPGGRARSLICDTRRARRGTSRPSTLRLHPAIAERIRDRLQPRHASRCCSGGASVSSVPVTRPSGRGRRWRQGHKRSGAGANLVTSGLRDCVIGHWPLGLRHQRIRHDLVVRTIPRRIAGLPSRSSRFGVSSRERRMDG